MNLKTTLAIAATAGIATLALVAAAPAQAAPLSSWNFTETRANGHYELVSTGLHVWTDGSTDTAPRTDGGSGDWNTDKVAGYLPVTVPLEDAGTPALDYEVTSGQAAGLNLTVYVDGNWFGNLVYEPLFEQYWTSKAVGTMPAGPNPSYQKAYGTLADFTAAWGTGHAVIRAAGFSLGSGAQGDGIVHDVTVGDTTYTFDAVTPPTSTPTPTTPPTEAPATPAAPAPKLTNSSAPANGTDIDDAAFSYTVSGLTPNSAFTLTAHSTPRVIASGVANSAGVAIITAAKLPADLAAGTHHITFTGTAADGTAYDQTVVWFTLSADGTITAVSTTDPSSLASTGFDASGFVLPALAALLLGGLAFGFSRRRATV